MDTPTLPTKNHAQISPSTTSASTWFSRWKVKLALLLGSLSLLFAIYFIGRRNRLGELNLEVAKRELEKADEKHKKLQQEFTILHSKRVSILSDILEHETKKLPANLSDADITQRLRADGLIK